MSTIDRLHIFLAEDDQDDSLLFCEAVTELATDATVTVAGDGVSFMSRLKRSEKTPDIIFLDINMPLKNGLECLNDIRADRDYDEVPVVLLSTSTDQLLLDSAYNAGANLYIQKPPSYKNLKAVIGKCLHPQTILVPPPVKEQFLLLDN